MSTEGGGADAAVCVWSVVVTDEVAIEAGVGGGDAVVGSAIALAAARGAGDPEGFMQRSTAATAAAVARANNRLSVAFKSVALIAVDVIVGVVGVVVGTGEAAPSPSVALALGCEAVADVVGAV